MGFPILSLIVTRIIGIPQSLLLRVLGFPNSHPGSMGFPMPFFRLSPKVFFVSGIVTFIAKSHEFPLVFAITAARPCSLGRHWLYLEFEHELTSCNRFLITFQWTSNPRTCKTIPSSTMNFQRTTKNSKDQPSVNQGQKGKKPFTRRLSNDVAADLLSN